MSHRCRQSAALMTQLIWIMVSILVLSLIAFASAPASQADGGQWYYVDSIGGNDNNDGLSPSSAWKSLSPIYYESHLFQPGDTIALNRGSYWYNNGAGDSWPSGLKMGRSGTADNPITITTYGSGDRPEIYCSMSGCGAIDISGDYVHVEDITVIGAEDYGVLISGEHVTLDHIVVTDAETGIVIHGQHNTVDTCTIYGLESVQNASGIYITAPYNTVVDSYIADAESQGILTLAANTKVLNTEISNVGIGIAARASNSTIADCVIHGLNEIGSTGTGGTGIYFEPGGSGSVVSGCEIYDAEEFGIVVEGDQNTLTDLDISDAIIGVVIHSDDNVIQGSVIHDVHDGGSNEKGTTVYVTGDSNEITDCDLYGAHEYGVLVEGDQNTLSGLEISDVGTGIVLNGDSNIATSCYIHDLNMIDNTPGGVDDRGAVGVYFEGSYNEASYNRLINCRDECYDWGHDGGAFEWGGSGYNQGNYVHHNWAEGCSGFFEGGVATIRATRIAYNISVNNGRFGTLLFDGPFAGDIEDFRVENNTIIEDDPAQCPTKNLLWFNGDPGYYEFALRNNIIVTVNSEYIFEADYNEWDIIHENNIYYVIDPDPGFEPGFDLHQTEIIANPRFRDLGARDLRLRQISPAIDWGTDQGYDYDYRHVPVPSGDEPDAGAYEYAPRDFQHFLPLGWNLASLPITPNSTDIGDVLASLANSFDQVRSPDPATGGATDLIYIPSDPGSNTLYALDELTPFWIHMTRADTLTLDGAAVGRSPQPLVEGWNMVSYPDSSNRPLEEALASIDGHYSKVNGYDASNSLAPWLRYAVGAQPWVNTLAQLEPGHAYHIHVDQDCELVLGD